MVSEIQVQRTWRETRDEFPREKAERSEECAVHVLRIMLGIIARSLAPRRELLYITSLGQQMA